MDPIHPIAPGPPGVPRAAVPPVARLPRVARERDRPAQDGEERRRQPPPPEIGAGDGDDEPDGPRHIDIIA